MFNKFIIDNFDFQRAIIRDSIIFEPFIVSDNDLIPLQTALDTSLIHPDTPLLVFTIGTTTLCLNLVNMIYHHVAQGKADDTAWMVSFCVVCNAGMLFSPRVQDKIYHFADGGFYNAMTLLTDKETRSVWNHITGQCLHGVHRGYQLNHLGAPLQKTPLQVLAENPKAIFAHSQLASDILAELQTDNAERLNPDMQLSPRALSTLKLSDDRLPRFDMGLGIWTPTTQRFYPYRKIILENAILDTLDGRNLLIYISPIGVAPEAIYTTATRFEWLRDILKLDNGQVIRDGVLYDGDGLAVVAERPQQLFQRWYSFTLLFADCEIYK